MNQQNVREILERLQSGQCTVDQAVLALKMEPFQDIGVAKIDRHRGLRQGAAEVIYGAGKTPEQIRDIAAAMRAQGQPAVLSPA